MATSLTKAALVAVLIIMTAGPGVAAAQSAEQKSSWDKLKSMMSAPKSPDGTAMEAVWDRAPEAPDGNFEDARPYFVSRWGGIVVRGKRNGEFVDRAVAARASAVVQQTSASPTRLWLV